jgi:hypothetical protein
LANAPKIFSHFICTTCSRGNPGADPQLWPQGGPKSPALPSASRTGTGSTEEIQEDVIYLFVTLSFNSLSYGNDGKGEHEW